MSELVIRQGSNSPILLEFDVPVSAFSKMSAVLYRRMPGIVKSWDFDNSVVSENTVQLPLKESETLTWEAGKYFLDVKCMDDAGTVIIYDMVAVNVEARYNREVLGGA